MVTVSYYKQIKVLSFLDLILTNEYNEHPVKRVNQLKPEQENTAKMALWSKEEKRMCQFRTGSHVNYYNCSYAIKNAFLECNYNTVTKMSGSFWQTFAHDRVE